MRAKVTSKLEINYCRRFGQIKISFALTNFIRFGALLLSGETTDPSLIRCKTEFETRNKMDEYEFFASFVVASRFSHAVFDVFHLNYMWRLKQAPLNVDRFNT